MRPEDSHGGSYVYLNLNLTYCIALTAGIKQQADNVLSSSLTNGTDNTPLKDELPVLVIAHGDEMDNKTGIIIALMAHMSTSTNSVTNVYATDSKSPTLAEFVTAQCADEFCQHAARKYSLAGKLKTYNKKCVFMRSVPIHGALQWLMSHSLQQAAPS